MALPPQHLHAPGCAAPLGGQCTCEPRPVSAGGDNPAASFLVGGQRYEESLTGWEIDDNLLAVLANGGQTPVNQKPDQKPPDDPTKRPKGQSKIARGPDPEREDAIPIGLLIALVVIFGFVVLAARPQLASAPELAWIACLSIIAMVVIGVVDRVLRYLSR